MTINLSGYVVADEDAMFYRWFGVSCFCPFDIRAAVAQAEDADDDLVITLNSGGGSVFAGFEIYSVLKACAVPVLIRIQSLAASAASIIMLGADRIEVSPVGEIMIHLPSTVTEGDAADHAKSIEILSTITESMLNAYQERCGTRRTRSEIRSMVESEKWMTAQEAVEYGFADGIIGENSGINPSAFAAAAGGLPDIAQIRAAYFAAHPEGAPAPASPSSPAAGAAAADKAQRARTLEIEKIRYGG